MSKKVLILGIVVVAVVLAAGGVATYVWLDYTQAHDSLTRMQQDVRDVGDNMRRHPEDVARLQEMYKLTKIEVDAMAESHHTWINEDDIAALRTALEGDKQAIDRLPGAAGK